MPTDLKQPDICLFLKNIILDISLFRFFENHFQCFPPKWQLVPKSDEREAKEETKSSPKVGDEGGDRVDQLLCPGGGLLRGRPQGEEEALSFEAHSFFSSDKVVFPVLARLQAACQCRDILQICGS